MGAYSAPPDPMLDYRSPTFKAGEEMRKAARGKGGKGKRGRKREGKGREVTVRGTEGRLPIHISGYTSLSPILHSDGRH